MHFAVTFGVHVYGDVRLVELGRLSESTLKSANSVDYF